MEVLRWVGSGRCCYKLPEHQRASAFPYQSTESSLNQGWLVLDDFCFLPFFFPCKCFCNTKLSHLMGDLVLCCAAISTCLRSAASPSRGFSTRVQIYGKVLAATPNWCLCKICKKKKKLEYHWKTRTCIFALHLFREENWVLSLLQFADALPLCSRWGINVI